MIATLMLTLAPILQDFEVQPRTLEPRDIGPAVFDLRWCLPEGKRTAPGDLPRRMEELLALRFELPAAEGGREPRRLLGDLVLAARRIEGGKREAWLGKQLRSDKSLEAKWGEDLRQLLLDDQLQGGNWNPDEDGERDGFLFGSAWDLAKEGDYPWTAVGGSTLAEEAAILVFADLSDWKAVENDYRRYPDMIGANYEAIYPVRGSYRRGLDGEGSPLASLEIHFRSDLPFPYSDYSCDLRILNRLDEKGRLTTDIYSHSEDFHWMAGRDVFLPVECSEGNRVAYLVVRTFGFDLDDVPDARKHRQAGLRQSLGNLKLRAEARRRERGEESLSDVATMPEFRVLGRR